ncbi:lipopolysaccharide biosynthesis protein [Foetidibacter luteolus]|uniref:lipopolysaccharide biosynthesis protein n=1 Tax=Foetidibacter luteolus TaxID=2608880 RepID=UPI001F2ABA26|nr:oligosaccharide flippase family protein [Foetidibacter luteolus]
MSSIKKLAGQTLWYGLSTIASRFINLLLTPYLTYNALVSTADYGKMGAVYAAIPIVNVIFTYGMETAYFRFIHRKDNRDDVNATTAISLIISTLLFSVILWLNQQWLAKMTSLEELPLLIQLSIIIIALDALTTIPFAKLRNEGRPKQFAFIKVSSIVVNVAATVFFLSYCPARIKENPNTWLILIYKPDVNPITYVLLGNVIQNIYTLLLLSKKLFPAKWKFDIALWKEMMVYALPILVAGLGGMINETFDRLMLGWWLPGSAQNADEQRGIYNACYKLSILITLFIQAFRMGAEPFFFKQAEGDNPQRTYARVMKFFVITLAVMFLVVSLYIPLWKYIIGEKYWVGLPIVPILLLANVCLGIYINLGVWYKVSGYTMAGAWITLIGAAITITINWLFIPRFGYMACAWATLTCYASMMVISFTWGQKKYYIPYAWKKLLAYIVIAILIFCIHQVVTSFIDNTIAGFVIAALFILAFLYLLVRVERKEFQRLPVIGRFIH